jgi:hypothetical protein
MADPFTPAVTGRPTKITEEAVAKLESILKIGGTVKEACSFALIHESTYYRALEDSETFASRMESAKHYADIAAKNVIVDKIIIDKDDANARWWLEKRRPEEFGGVKAQPDVTNQQFNIFFNDDQLTDRLADLFSGANERPDQGAIEAPEPSPEA